MRKDVCEGVRKFINDGIKSNFAALARQYGCDYRMVKAAYEAETQYPVKKKRVKRKSKLDEFKPIIHDKLEIQCSAYSIFKFIKKRGMTGVTVWLSSHILSKREENPSEAGNHACDPHTRFSRAGGLERRHDFNQPSRRDLPFQHILIRPVVFPQEIHHIDL